MIADGFVKCSDSVFDIVFIEDLGYFCIMGFRKGNQEIVVPVL